MLVRPQKIAQVRLVGLQVGEAKSIDCKVRTSYSDPPSESSDYQVGGTNERPESTRVPKVFLRIARKSILFEQKT